MVGALPDDIQAIRQDTLNRFGTLEWDKCVLTNLVHGHLGIYSILGVKMGLRALELLEARPEHPGVRVHSFAGNVPPVSCMNDGLQIGTGSTLGRGLITVEPCERPEAQFSYAGKVLRLSLKPEFARQIEAGVAGARERYGEEPAYWQAVREMALEYWSTWDRQLIFNESFAE